MQGMFFPVHSLSRMFSSFLGMFATRRVLAMVSAENTVGLGWTQHFAFFSTDITQFSALRHDITRKSWSVTESGYFVAAVEFVKRPLDRRRN